MRGSPVEGLESEFEKSGAPGVAAGLEVGVGERAQYGTGGLQGRQRGDLSGNPGQVMSDPAWGWQSFRSRTSDAHGPMTTRWTTSWSLLGCPGGLTS